MKSNLISHDNDKLFTQNNLSVDQVLLEPVSGILSSRNEADVNSTIIYNSPMDTIANDLLGEKLLSTDQAYLTCSFFSNKDRLLSLDKFYNKPNFWFTVDDSLDDFDLLEAWWYQKQHLIKNRVRLNISLDVPYGDTNSMIDLYKKYRAAPWVNHIMSGPIATSVSAYNVYCAGCSHLRIGLGTGSRATTSTLTGCGVPNLSAVYNIYNDFQLLNLKTNPVLIADGDPENPGDITKYLSAGASAVMLGKLLSKCSESSGWKVNFFKWFINKLTFNAYFKSYFYKYHTGRFSRESQQHSLDTTFYANEHKTILKSYFRYSYSDFYTNLILSLSSSLSYLGLTNITQLSPGKVRFIKVAPSGYKKNSSDLFRI